MPRQVPDTDREVVSDAGLPRRNGGRRCPLLVVPVFEAISIKPIASRYGLIGCVRRDSVRRVPASARGPDTVSRLPGFWREAAIRAGPSDYVRKTTPLRAPFSEHLPNAATSRRATGTDGPRLRPAALLALGPLAWAVSSNPKVADAGRIAFAVGLLAFVLARHTVKIG